VETISSSHIYFLYILFATVVAAIAIGVAGKKGFYALMKGKFMETDEIRESLLTKEEFDHQCFVRKSSCAKSICDKIQELKNGQEAVERKTALVKEQVEKDAETIKNQVEKNLAEVKGKINGVSSDVKELRISMQFELKEITRFMGSVDQYMKKNNVGK